MFEKPRKQGMMGSEVVQTRADTSLIEKQHWLTHRAFVCLDYSPVEGEVLDKRQQQSPGFVST